MKKTLLLFAAIAPLAFCGCLMPLAAAGKAISEREARSSAPAERVMASWMGHHKGDLILKWGPPTRTASDGRGGEILIYEYDNTGAVIKPDRRYSDSTRNTYKVEKTGQVAIRMFWANTEGTIYHWKTDSR